jgi:hypothetical protein
MKVCKNCGKTLSLDLFGTNARHTDGKNERCKPCVNALDKIRRSKANTKSTVKFNHLNSMKSLRRDYKITEWDYQDLLNKQQGQCAICSADFGMALEPKRPNGRQAHIDHDHVTGKIRGLLCMNCNIALGHIEKTSMPLAKLAEYLSYEV